MVTNGIPEFNVNDLTDFDNNDYCGSDFGFDRFNYQTDLSNVAGPSQVSAGADVCGELDNYPAFLPSPTEPESLYLDYGVYPREGKLCCTYRLSFNDSPFDRRSQSSFLPGYGCPYCLATIGDPPTPHPLRRPFLTYADPLIHP